jgi:hypothetical protein
MSFDVVGFEAFPCPAHCPRDSLRFLLRSSNMLTIAVVSSLALAPALQSRPAPVRTRPGIVRPAAGASPERVDFDEFPTGTILAQTFTSEGSGPIVVRGYNPFLGAGRNAAVIFDSAHPTGGDDDLGTPHLHFGGPGIGAGGYAGPFQNDEPKGKVLIVGENLNDWEGDGLVNVPDDLNAAATRNATLSFDFAALGSVTILGLTIIDVEASEQSPIVTYHDSNGVELGSATLSATGDNGVAEVDLGGFAGVSSMMIHMRGSGAVDELRLRREGTGSIAFVPDLVPVDLTPNGRTALLFDLFLSADGDTYFYDTVTDTLTFQTTVGPTIRCFPTGLSATKRISAIHGDPNEAGLWTSAGGWVDLGNVFPDGCGADQGAAWDVRADGAAAVGMLWNLCSGVAFHWTQASGLMPLDLLGASFPGSPSPPTNRATKIADDGSLVGGFAQTELTDRWPALWHPDGSGFLLPSGTFTLDAPGEVLSVAADGSMVAGIWNLEGFYWTATEGVVRLGTPPGGQTFPNAIAANARLIFGKNQLGFFDPPAAFVWTRTNGMRSLADVATTHGAVIPPGVVLDNVLAASADGSIVLGSAFDDTFRFYTFVLSLPVSAYGL